MILIFNPRVSHEHLIIIIYYWHKSNINLGSQHVRYAFD